MQRRSWKSCRAEPETALKRGAAFSALPSVVAILPFLSGANTQETVEIGRKEGWSRSSMAN